MSVDLHRIGTGISSGSSRNGFGNIVSFPSVSGFPAAGTFNSWLYGVAWDSGPYVSIPENSTTYPTKNGDVIVKNDGAGGTYIDWATLTNVEYYANGIMIVTLSGNLYIYINTSCTSPPTQLAGYYNHAYYHDGNGDFTTGGSNSWYSYGTLLYSEECDYVTLNYYADGNGGYYS